MVSIRSIAGAVRAPVPWGALAAVMIAGPLLCAAEPPVELMRLEVAAELEARLQQAVVEEKIAAELKVPWPALPPRRSPQEIAAELRRLGDKPRAASETPPAANTDPEIETAAAAAVPLARIGDTVAVRLLAGGETRGELTRNDEGAVTVGGRTIRRSALTPESIAMLDQAANRSARDAWIRQELIRRAGAADTTIIGGERKLEAELYRAAGYVRWRDQWVSPVELVQKAAARKRADLTKKLQPEIVQEVAARYGYTWRDGAWHPLPPATVTAAGNPAAAAESVPVTPQSAAPPSASTRAVSEKPAVQGRKQKSQVALLFDLKIEAPEAAAPVAVDRPLEAP